MSRLYLTYNERSGKREYYSYDVLQTGPVYIVLNEEEVKAYLNMIVTSSLARAREVNDSLMEIETQNGDIVIVDNAKVFSRVYDEQDSLIAALAQTVKTYLERKRREEYKRENPNYKTKRVNRKKRNKWILRGLSISAATIMVANILVSEIKKDDLKEEKLEAAIEDVVETKTQDKIAYEIVENGAESLTEKAKNIISEQENKNAIHVEVGFDDVTDSGKLEQTMEDCSPYMDYWIDRYGLPRNITYALLSLESGIPECIEQKNGATGPTQLQVRAQHKEHYKIAVMKDGKYTGEYDEFWAADINRLDDPDLEGKPIKIIQNLEDNCQIGCAYFRRCIDRYHNIFLAIDAYNKGLYAMNKVYEKCGDQIEKTLDYYKEHMEDFSWSTIIPTYSKEVFDKETYGDPTYIWDVLKHLETDTRGETTIEYYFNGELITVDIKNTNVYNNEQRRGM